MQLIKLGQILQDGKTLSYYKITRTQTLTLAFKAIGGMALYVPQQKNGGLLFAKRNRSLDTSDPDIKISSKPDCLTYCTNEKRAQMPCGHVYTPTSMFNLIREVFTKNDYGYIVCCPHCATVWDFDLVAKVADLNDDEYLYFSGEIEKRCAPEIKACPTCGADNQRPDSLRAVRVNCPVCSGGDWCWSCEQDWHGGGFSVCGNSDCPTAEINAFLKSCPEKETTYGNDSGKVRVPQFRACPNCLEYIEHEDACKHMTCAHCGHNFCFSCLLPQQNGSWQCDSVSVQCKIAPRQIIK